MVAMEAWGRTTERGVNYRTWGELLNVAHGLHLCITHTVDWSCSRYAVGPGRLAVARFSSCKHISSLNDALIPSRSPSSILKAPKKCPWGYGGGGAGSEGAVQDTTNTCAPRVGLWVELDKYQQRKECILLYYIHATTTSENVGAIPYNKHGAPIGLVLPICMPTAFLYVRNQSDL